MAILFESNSSYVGREVTASVASVSFPVAPRAVIRLLCGNARGLCSVLFPFVLVDSWNAGAALLSTVADLRAAAGRAAPPHPFPGHAAFFLEALYFL